MATAVYADILRRAGGIPEDGTVSLDNLENFLIEEFPGSSPYDILKSIEKDTRDRLYAGTPMLKEVSHNRANIDSQRCAARGARLGPNPSRVIAASSVPIRARLRPRHDAAPAISSRLSTAVLR